jgi:SAM-dependent methyltransferase
VTLTIETEFQSLIPPLTDEEKAQLEANLINEGCRDALVAWRNGEALILVDGHNRHEICTRLDIPYEVKEKEFDTRADAKVWILENQLGRRNLPEPQRIKLALQLKPALEEQAKENQKRKPSNFVRPKSDEQKVSDDERRTDNSLAKKAGVGKNKLRQAEEVLKHAPVWIKEKYEAQEITANRAHRLMNELKAIPEKVKALFEKWEIIEPKLIPILIRLCKRNSETFDELFASGVIQYGDEGEAIPLSEASDLDLQKYLDYKAKQHRLEAKEAKREASEIRGKEVEDASLPITLLCGDFRVLCQDIEPQSVDLIFTDPPYHRDNLHLWDALAREAKRLLKPSGLLVAYSGQYLLPNVLQLVGQQLDYYWMMAAEHQRGQLRLWDRQCWNSWKPLIMWSNGEPDHHWFGDFLRVGSDDAKERHDWAQPLSEASEVIRRLYPAGNILVLDPMCGSGTIPIAAAKMNCRAVGIEINERDYYMALDRANQILRRDEGDKTTAA